MAFNKDIHSLFDRYVKNILQEQGPPRPVEVGPDDPINNQVSPGHKISRNDAIKQWEQMTGKTYSSLTPEQKRQTARFLIKGMQTGQVTPPASLQGKLPVNTSSPSTSTSQNTGLTPDDDEYVDPDLNYKTPQPTANRSSTTTNTTTTNNQSTRTGGGSTTVFADRDEAGQQAAAERARQKREAGSQGASRIVGRPDPGTAAGQAAIAQNQQDIAAKQQQQADARKAQEESDRQSLQRIQNTGSNTSQPATTSPSSTTTATGTETQAQKEARWAAEAQAANAQTALNKATGSTKDSMMQPSNSQDDGKFFDQMAAKAGLGASASIPTPEELAGVAPAGTPLTNNSQTKANTSGGIVIGNPSGSTSSTSQSPVNAGGGIVIGNPSGGTQQPSNKPVTLPSAQGNITIGNPQGTQQAGQAQPATAKSAPTGGYTQEQIAAFNKANSAGRKDWEFNPNSRVDREKMQKMLGGTGQQSAASTALPGAGMKPGEIKTPTPAMAAAQQPQQPQPQQQMGGALGGISRGIGAVGTAAKTALVGNQPLGGVAGGISKGIGSIGNIAKNVLIGGQQQGNPQQASQQTQQQAKRPGSPNPKVR